MKSQMSVIVKTFTKFTHKWSTDATALSASLLSLLAHNLQSTSEDSSSINNSANDPVTSQRLFVFMILATKYNASVLTFPVMYSELCLTILKC